MKPKQAQAGFTLVEMIVVIVITGIIGGMVAIFLRAPVQQYVATARRAEITDIADTATRRIGRDLRLALPNSVRVTSAGLFLEFLPTRGGGRYRVDAAATGTAAGCGSLNADVLNFSDTDPCFEVFGPPMAVNTFTAGTDRIAVYNLGIAGADAYAGNNTAGYASNTASSITINPAFRFPFESPSARFQVITTPVSYVCIPIVGGVGGTLTRYWGYPMQPLQTAVDTTAELIALTTPATRAVLANNVSTCNFSYDANVVAQRSGLLTLNLGITLDGETVNLYSATHVSNVP